MTESLWGEEFTIKETVKEAKKIIKKISEPKVVKTSSKKVNKSLSIDDKLATIRASVYETLGRYEDSTQILTTRSELTSYIDKAIENGIIAIDTETNNSLDPITCKLMGPCIYTPGLKNVYIPINHVDPHTLAKLEWQLTEQDIYEEFSRLSNTKIIMHNGKFDYQVLKCTCNLILDIYWDTMIAAKVLDENERSAGLKQQYIDKIDPSIEKYSIDELFENIEYAVVDPNLFALYAATDAYMTYQLYLWQKEQFEKPENKGINNLFTTLEMPLVKVIAEMEMAGMEVDQEYASLLSAKYHKLLDEIDVKIYTELETLKPQIEAWKLTPEANMHPPKKTGDGEGKSKVEQLEDPINLASPTQLAILFYDILKAPQVDKKSPRGTGEDALKAIADKLNLNICKLILERREWVKLVTTYVDVIPELAKRWPDGRVRTHFNAYGAATGRLSSSDPINFQNIPSHNKEIRMLFKAHSEESNLEPTDNIFYIKKFSEVETPAGMQFVDKLVVGDLLRLTDDEDNSILDSKILEINLINNIYEIKVETV